MINRGLQLICPERPVQQKMEFLQQKRRQKRQRLTQAWVTKRTREPIRTSRESTLSTSSLILWGWIQMLPLKLIQSIFVFFFFHFFSRFPQIQGNERVTMCHLSYLLSRQDVVTSLPEDSKEPPEREIQRMSSAFPTMWLGAQNGW